MSYSGRAGARHKSLITNELRRKFLYHKSPRCQEKDEKTFPLDQSVRVLECSGEHLKSMSPVHLSSKKKRNKRRKDLARLGILE